MNARTLEYIGKHNSPESTRLANNKLATKRALQKAGLPTPRLYAVIRSRNELKSFNYTKLPPSFVLKPNSASGGGGIMVIFGRNKKGNWVKANKEEVFIPELKNQLIDILDGSFSKSNVPDSAFFEQRVRVHPALKTYSVKGVPDIRVLVYNLVPVMAMVRLPTEESSGRANLHAGGIGVGIDLSLGITTTAVQRGHYIDTLPNSRLGLAGIRLPYWDDILLLAIRTAQATGLEYVGVDIALDRDDGPMVLEINARPGLDIQFANSAPLRNRLRRVEGLKTKSIEKKIALAKSLFGGEIEQEIEGISGRAVLGIHETITIFDNQGNPHAVSAKIDTGAWRTTIDEKLAESLGIDKPIIDHKQARGALGMQMRPVVTAQIQLRNQIIKTEISLANRERMNFSIIIGRRDLKGFLVDPYKNSPKG